MYTILLYFLGIISYNLNYLITIILSLIFDIYIFKSKDDTNYSKKLLDYIDKNKNYRESIIIQNSKEYPKGLCLSKSKKFASYIDYETITSTNNQVKANYTIYFIGKLPFEITEIKQEIEVDLKTNEKKCINIYVRQNPWFDSTIFNLIELPFDYEPYESQNTIVDEIIDNYKGNRTNIGRYLITGKTGTGKSFIAKFLAKKLKSKLTFDIKLDLPGGDINSLYLNADGITKETPLIILLDEWDIMINNIHKGKFKREHNWLITSIYNKETYNNFMSERVLLFPYVIYIFTMNSTIETINELDPCYLRTGRIDKKFNL